MNTAPFAAVGLAVLFVIFLSTAAFGLPMPIEFNLDTLGKVTVNAVTAGSGHEGLRGRFEVTKKNPDGSTMTIEQLEMFLGEDHLNWFQKAISNRTPTPDFPGRFIDPQKGGQGDQWADDRPWYFDEFRPPSEPFTDTNGNGIRDGAEPFTDLDGDGMWDLDITNPARTDWNIDFLLDTNVMGSRFEYFDFPRGLDFDVVTCLISDFGNKKYHVLDGCFSWTATPGADGLTDITALNKGAAFTSEFAKEIFDDFGYRIPLPPTLLLLACGVAGLVSTAAWRKRRRA